MPHFLNQVNISLILIMIIILYINSNVNIPYNILITGIKRIKQYPTDLDIQCGFQGFKNIFGYL